MVRRIESLDILRGLAAMAVVVWHWNWLLVDPSTGTIPAYSISELPFLYLLFPLYKAGYLAVDLFFAISGFVFFHMYAERLARGEVAAREFWWNRFTRLYPLHIATLLYVTVIQLIYHSSHAGYFIYPDNSPMLFASQLFMASNWLPSAPYSFNGPIWSVSIEILLYGLFFVLARCGLIKPWHVVFPVWAGSFLITEANMLGHGIMTFFTGALCYYTFKNRREFRALVAAIVGAGIIQIAHSGVSLRICAVTVGIPTVLLVLSLCEHRLKPIAPYLGWLGHTSYSSYLLHFPVMLTLVTIGLRVDPYSHVHLIAYLIGVVLLSLACFRYFERPLQMQLRNLALQGSPRSISKTELATEAGQLPGSI
jgi:peptidoglycan/LPS O-acetylase OafA/YrhL